MGFTEIRGAERERGGALDGGDQTRPGEARRGKGGGRVGERSEMETEGLLPGISVHAVNCYC